MASNNAKNILLKHLARAPRYAVQKAMKEATTQDERESIQRIAAAVGVHVDANAAREARDDV